MACCSMFLAITKSNRWLSAWHTKLLGISRQRFSAPFAWTHGHTGHGVLMPCTPFLRQRGTEIPTDHAQPRLFAKAYRLLPQCSPARLTPLFRPLIAGASTSSAGLHLDRGINAHWTRTFPCRRMMAWQAQRHSVIWITSQGRIGAPRLNVMDFKPYAMRSTVLARVVIPRQDRLYERQIFRLLVMTLPLCPMPTFPIMRSLPREILSSTNNATAAPISLKQSWGGIECHLALRADQFNLRRGIASTCPTMFALASYRLLAYRTSISCNGAPSLTTLGAKRRNPIFLIVAFGTSVFRHRKSIAHGGELCNYH